MELSAGAKNLHKKLKENKVLIAAHRGTNGGNVIQNTLMAYETAMQHGSDLVEIDVIMSTDGDFYAFHNGQEKYLLREDRDIRDMSSKEIDKCNCYNSVGEVSGQKLERLEYVLEGLRDRCFINIDRSWFYWKEIIEFLKKVNMDHQIILKSPVDKELLHILQESKSQIMYMPIVKNMDEWNLVREYDVNLVAAELIFETLESPLVQKEFIEKLHEAGILAWVNAITLNDRIVLSAGLDDDNSIKNSYDENWGKLIEMGFDMIQTDWPALIKEYILSRFN